MIVPPQILIEARSARLAAVEHSARWTAPSAANRGTPERYDKRAMTADGGRAVEVGARR